MELRTIADGPLGARAVILTGAGRGFCAGVDLHGYGAAPGNDGSDAPRDRLANQEHMSRLILELRALPQPVIAAVNGPAAGFGLALALGCDIRYAAPEAVFRVGLHEHRRVQLRHGHQLAAAAPDRRLALARADADRPAGRRRGGAAHRPGGGRRRARASCSIARCEGGRSDRGARAVGRAPHQAGDVDGARDRVRAGGASSTRTASRSWRRSAARCPRRPSAFLREAPRRVRGLTAPTSGRRRTVRGRFRLALASPTDRPLGRDPSGSAAATRPRGRPVQVAGSVNRPGA